MAFKIIGYVVAATMVFIALGFAISPQVKFERDIVVNGSSDDVFRRVNSLREFQTWSPWAVKDPAMKIAFSGPEAGEGAKMTWSSASLGDGAQEIKESAFGKSVLYRIDMAGADVAFATITLTPEAGDKTKVVWAFKTDLGVNPFKRWMGLIYPAMIAPDYEAGLARLKDVVEGKIKTSEAHESHELDPSTLPPALEKALTEKGPVPSPVPTPEEASRDPDIVTVTPRPIVFVQTRAKENDAAAVTQALGNANTVLFDFVMRHSLEASGAPLAISSQHESTGERRFDVALPLSSVPKSLPDEGKVQLGETPGGKAIMMVHKGPYATIEQTYDKLRAKIREKGLKEGKFSWEEYVTDSSEVDESELLTNVYIQVE